MNNPEVRARARGLARRCAAGRDGCEEQAIQAAYATALGRDPTPQEIADSMAFLDQQSGSYRSSQGDARLFALTDFCQALLCTNEFVYVD